MTLCLALLIAACHWKATAVFDRTADELRHQQTKPVQRTLDRPVLFEPEHHSDAWESYSPILTSLTSFPGKWTYPTPPPEEHARLLIAARPVLDGLRKAHSTKRLTCPPPFTSAGVEDFTFTRALMGASGILVRIAMGYHLQKQDPAALDTLVLLLSTIADLRDVAGHEMLPMEWSLGEEAKALYYLRDMMRQNSLTVMSLARTRTQLETLYSARTTPYAVVAQHGLWWRQQLLKWELEDAPGFPSPYENSTSWRCMFSPRLGRAMAITHVERFWNGFQQLEHLPPQQWMPTLDLLIKSEQSFSADWPLGDVRSLYERECANLRMYASARLALAIAHFEVDHTTFPMTLSDLSPTYLDGIPTCPAGGEAFAYSAGEFHCSHGGSHWKVGRAK